MMYKLIVIIINILIIGALLSVFDNYAVKYFNDKKNSYKKDIDLQLFKIFQDGNLRIGQTKSDYIVDSIDLNFSDKKFSTIYNKQKKNDIEKNILIISLEAKDINDLKKIRCFKTGKLEWKIFVIEKWSNTFISQMHYIPIAVGFKTTVKNKKEKLTISKCLNNDKYLRYINNDTLSYYNIGSIKNRYFSFEKNLKNTIEMNHLFYNLNINDSNQQYIKNKSKNLYVSENENFRIYLIRSEADSYYLNFNENQYIEDLNIAYKYGIIIIVLVVSILSFFSYKKIYNIISIPTKIDKSKNSNLSDYEFILLNCSPINYIEPYDPIKVDISNKILSSAISNRNNYKKLKSLKSKAIKKLNIKNY